VTAPGGSGAPHTRLDRVLGCVPRFLSSHVHVIWLIGLGVYLIVLPLAGVKVSASAELIGGNYTNVTSDIGACIAAGGTLTALKHARKSHRIMADLYRRHTGQDHPDAPPGGSPP